MNSRGNVAIITAIMATVLVGFAGFAADTTRVWLVETRLQTAIDAAALVAARRLTDATRDTEATAVFWAHFSQNGGSRSYLGATISNPVIALDPANNTRIRVSATATVPTTLFGVLSDRPVTRAESAVAQRAGSGLELALVIDHTSSMRSSAGNGLGTKLDAAKAAATSLLDILYAGRDTQLNLWVSVVPFARTINIGTTNSAMLDTSNMPAGWNLANWSGCVEARTGGNDITGAAPTGTGRFRPYYWPSTYQQVGTRTVDSRGRETGRCTDANAYAAIGGVRYCHGDNDWNTGTLSQSALNGNYMYNYLRNNQGLPEAQSRGPNLLCALTPIQPLTASRATVNAAINAIQAPIRSGGTTTPVGLQGAWYTLSPAWQGYWQNPNASIPDTPALPLPYNTRYMRKVVVMLTDGDDNWQGAYQSATDVTCGSTSKSVCSSASGTELLYNAYGRVTTTTGWNARFPSATINPVSQANADPRLSARFAAICSAMKAAGTDIIIYIIGFEVASADRSRLQACATSTAHYFESPTASDLQRIFEQIGTQLASLRLAE